MIQFYWNISEFLQGGGAADTNLSVFKKNQPQSSDFSPGPERTFLSIRKAALGTLRAIARRGDFHEKNIASCCWEAWGGVWSYNCMVAPHRLRTACITQEQVWLHSKSITYRLTILKQKNGDLITWEERPKTTSRKEKLSTLRGPHGWFREPQG